MHSHIICCKCKCNCSMVFIIWYRIRINWKTLLKANINKSILINCYYLTRKVKEKDKASTNIMIREIIWATIFLLTFLLWALKWSWIYRIQMGEKMERIIFSYTDTCVFWCSFKLKCCRPLHLDQPFFLKRWKGMCKFQKNPFCKKLFRADEVQDLLCKI